MQSVGAAATPTAFYVATGLGVINLAAVFVSLTLAYRSLKRSHEWNRRKASHDLLIQLASGDIRAIRGRLEADFGARIFDPTQSYGEAIAALPAPEAKAELRFLARTVLNYFETMAIGIKNNVLEDVICFDYAAETVAAFWQWSRPLVKEIRPVAPGAWTELELLAGNWARRQETSANERRLKAQIPGLPRT
jgi:hypothetical protein